ncbi:hypothetical protein HU200_007348 [Digitaria exilis]|uniref:Inhibitor I9 domain-containing protein n=1 Tax=Digitaria exilis TaxID=1010633 RepID=A0A835FQL7_9POAL|nr:hypothetical protein HU200_007348 [Digitaria exilis]
MALVKKGTGVVLLAALILLSAAAASMMYSMNPPRASRPWQPPIRYTTFRVILGKPPNAAAMDEAAHRRWHQSFLPSTQTDSGELRLRNSYYNCTRYGIYAFAALLTDDELGVVAKKPGFKSARPCNATRTSWCTVPARRRTGWKSRIAKIVERFLVY